VEQPKFRVGDKLVYPNHGVVVLEQIGESPIFGTDAIYYHLRLLANNARFMVPVKNADRLGLRALYSREQLQEVYRFLEEIRRPLSDWKGRYRENLDRMKTGRLEDVAVVARDLDEVSRGKSLSFREKKMYDRAKYLLTSEIAAVREIPEFEAERILGLLLESPQCPDCRTTMIRGRRGLECTYCNAGAMNT